MDAAVRILEEIQPASVRAVCYRLFTEGLIPSMEKTNTNGVSRQLVRARENGEIPWDWIVDETRRAERASTWNNPAQLLETAVRQYRRDYWSNQPEWVEVWSEKGSVRGTLAPVLDEYGITFRVMHGYGSATGLHDVAKESAEARKLLTVLYVGDYDPAGMHMSDIDLPTRLERYGGNIDVVRIAVANEDTTSEAGVPNFPARDKNGDTRYAWFVREYGNTCYELDAMSPVTLRDRVRAAIIARLEVDAWNHAIKVERAERESMAMFLKDYKRISGQATKYSGEAQ